MQQPIGILGGTFDPIHLGHLHLALEVHKQFDLAKIKIIPCYQSPTRSIPIASALDRVTMIKLAIAEFPNIELDEREIKQSKKSYTIETLQSLRQELPNTPLCLIIGADAFAHLSEWREWEKFTEFAHLIVVKRPNSVLEHVQPNPPLSKLSHNLSGGIFIAEINALNISSTMARDLIAQNKSISELVSQQVCDYILQNKLYRSHLKMRSAQNYA